MGIPVMLSLLLAGCTLTYFFEIVQFGTLSAASSHLSTAQTGTVQIEVLYGLQDPGFNGVQQSFLMAETLSSVHHEKQPC